MQLDFNELRDLLIALNQTDITELTLKSADFELIVRRGTKVEPTLLSVEPTTLVSTGLVPSNQVSPITPQTPGAATAIPGRETIARTSTETGISPPAPVTSPTPPLAEKKWVEITSPMVGTFYRAPGPDESPFVDVGDRIRVGQTVCIIEAMKLMNELEAEITGEVVEILVQNGEPVEYGQPLMRVNPS